ncbi:MAG: hypothetical protein QOI08_789 [Actinomycetota bacterium]|jgi:hypothetical protein|nr:hypothetical protein [Actinomycetota bacterium]
MSMKKKLFAAAAAATLIAAISAGPASADQFSNNSAPGFTINAGAGPRFDTAVATGAVFPTVGNFANVTMNGTPQLTSAAIAPFTVIDDSGTGAGWHVTLLVPNFTSGANVLPAAGVQMNAVVVAPGNTDSAMGGVWSDPNVDFTTAKTIVEANPADTTHNGGAPLGPDGLTKVAGVGTYLVSPQILKLIVPANALAGAYTTTATIAIVNTP